MYHLPGDHEYFKFDTKNEYWVQKDSAGRLLNRNSDTQRVRDKKVEKEQRGKGERV